MFQLVLPQKKEIRVKLNYYLERERGVQTEFCKNRQDPKRRLNEFQPFQKLLEK